MIEIFSQFEVEPSQNLMHMPSRDNTSFDDFLSHLKDPPYCIGHTNMRRCFLMKVCQIAIHNGPAILICFLMGVNDRTYTNRCGIVWRILWCISRVFASLFFKAFYTKKLEKIEKSWIFKNIQKNFSIFSSLLNVCFHVNRSAIKYLSTEKNFEKFSEFSLHIPIFEFF